MLNFLAHEIPALLVKFVQILLGLFILKITVQAMDNNFVGGDVIPNYLESFWLSFCEWVLSFTLPAFVRVFIFGKASIACMFIFSCLQFVGMRQRHFPLLRWTFFTLLLCWKFFSTRGHKPSLFRFRFLDLGLVLPQEDGSSDDIGFLTSQWRLVCDRIFVLCRPFSFDIPTLRFFRKEIHVRVLMGLSFRFLL